MFARLISFKVSLRQSCQQSRTLLGSHRAFSTSASPTEKAHVFAKSIKDARFAILSSTSKNPFVNLSIEHYLLQNSHPDSVIFFNYVNRPCVVIGRNQNPWLEVNLKHIDSPVSLLKWVAHSGQEKSQYIGHIDLVRRRSGGGTVFHDEGNFNYSVICPKDTFTRNKYVEMIVKALRSINARARVNERHDIVLDQGKVARFDTGINPGDTHRTPWEDDDVIPLKVSGSAFKLTRLRAMHHGTCLLHSPNLSLISGILRSPAAPYIKAFGVDSVRSPVGNAADKVRGTVMDELREAITREFLEMHQIQHDILASGDKVPAEAFSESGMLKILGRNAELLFGWVDEDHANLPDIRKGMEELTDPEWTYGQTPRFTFSSHPTDDDPRERPEPDFHSSIKLQVHLALKSGMIEEAYVSWLNKDNPRSGLLAVKERQNSLEGMKLREIGQLMPEISLPESRSEETSEFETARGKLSNWLTKTLIDPAGLYEDQQQHQQPLT